MSDKRPEARLTESADIVFSATVRADELHVVEVSQSVVTFHGEPDDESASGSRRTGLPDRVTEGAVYHSIQIDYVIASKVIAPEAVQDATPSESTDSAT
ncbi:MAG TPA: hypothetical protein VIR33_14905 [Thermopolyspora sp.]|jgi:hypothetical protein